jgi:hypothetical protein
MAIRKHRWLWLISLVGATSLFIYFLSRRSPAVSLEAEERIQFGMTEDEVLMILKAPPGDYRTRTVLYGGLHRSPEFLHPHDFHDPSPVVEREPLRMETWTTDYGEMKVWFDLNGRVAGKGFNDPAVSVGWLGDKVESILVKFGLKKPRMWCLN